VLEVYRAADVLQKHCESQHWRFCLIGGLALQRWGEPRETIDVDVTLLTGFGNEESFIREILSWYEPRVPDAVGFALQNRVVLAQTPSGVGIDIALGGLPFEEAVVERSTLYEFAPGTWLRTASAEDLIVMKAFASRAKDWVDVEGIAVRQAGKLDWKYVVGHLTPLAELKGEPEILDRLAALRVRAEEKPSGL